MHDSTSCRWLTPAALQGEWFSSSVRSEEMHPLFGAGERNRTSNLLITGARYKSYTYPSGGMGRTYPSPPACYCHTHLTSQLLYRWATPAYILQKHVTMCLPGLSTCRSSVHRLYHKWWATTVSRNRSPLLRTCHGGRRLIWLLLIKWLTGCAAVP